MATLPDNDFATQIFEDYVPLTDAAFDGRLQNVGNPKTGDIAAAWWTGKNRADKAGMWSEPRWHSVDGKDVLNKDFRVQIDFEPTHVRPKAD